MPITAKKFWQNRLTADWKTVIFSSCCRKAMGVKLIELR